MKKKDVLIMCQFFYPEYVSSATLPFDTAEYLSSKGYSVGALCGYPKEYSNEKSVPVRENVRGVDIRRLKYIQLSRKSFIGRFINYFSFTLSVFFNLFRAAKYKMIMVYSNPPVLPFMGVIAKKLFGCKLVFVSYDVYPEIGVKSGAMKDGGAVCRVLSFVNRSVFKNADTVVAVSSDMEEFLKNNRDIKDGCPTVTIPNWYRDGGEREKTVNLSNKLLSFIDDDDFVVSYLGNLGVCQDENTILSAMKLLEKEKNIKFIFAGHGVKMAELEKSAKEQGLTSCRFFPFLHGEDFADVLSASDCYIVSLVDGLLGLCAPSKAYSYMMEGRPIACIMHPDSEIALDIRENDCGKVFSSGDGEGMAEFFIRLGNDPCLCRNMGKRCRRVFLNKYEKEICLLKYEKLVDGLISRNDEKKNQSKV